MSGTATAIAGELGRSVRLVKPAERQCERTFDVSSQLLADRPPRIRAGNGNQEARALLQSLTEVYPRSIDTLDLPDIGCASLPQLLDCVELRLTVCRGEQWST